MVNFSQVVPVNGGLARYVKFTCCAGDGGCVDDMAGDATSCKDGPAWKTEASLLCEAQGHVLTAYTLVEACGTDAATAKAN